MPDQTRRRLVPYRLVSPGFEAVYTGEKSADPIHEPGWPISRFTDEAGNVIQQWSVWTWTPQDGEAHWNAEIQAINQLQVDLGSLDDETRRIRAQIGSLVMCDSGFPVTVDSLLLAIGRGQLGEPAFHTGCWCDSMWWDAQGTQPGQVAAMQAIADSLAAYLDGFSFDDLVLRLPAAEGFLRRVYAWLGPLDSLSQVQRLLLERILLPFQFFTKRNPDYVTFESECFGEDGRGQQLDERIAQLAGLPRIFPEYRPEFVANLQGIQDPEKRALYRICGAVAHGLHHLSDCHHSAFRWIETWIHGVGTGQWDIPTRLAGTERTRLSHLLFGYLLGLDSWLIGRSMQFLLLDLGHLDLGFDPKNEILRVYAYLGEAKTSKKEWLAACLWYNLAGGGNPRGLVIQEPLIENARQLGVSTRQFMDSLVDRTA